MANARYPVTVVVHSSTELVLEDWQRLAGIIGFCGIVLIGLMALLMIRLSAEALVDVSLKSDDFRGEPYQQLLGAVEGMEFVAGRGR